MAWLTRANSPAWTHPVRTPTVAGAGLGGGRGVGAGAGSGGAVRWAPGRGAGGGRGGRRAGGRGAGQRRGWCGGREHRDAQPGPARGSGTGRQPGEQGGDSGCAQEASREHGQPRHPGRAEHAQERAHQERRPPCLAPHVPREFQQVAVLHPRRADRLAGAAARQRPTWVWKASAPGSSLPSTTACIRYRRPRGESASSPRRR